MDAPGAKDPASHAELAREVDALVDECRALALWSLAPDYARNPQGRVPRGAAFAGALTSGRPPLEPDRSFSFLLGPQAPPPPVKIPGEQNRLQAMPAPPAGSSKPEVDGAATAAAGLVQDPVAIIARVLRALEYETAAKVEGDVVARLHRRFGVAPAPTVAEASRALAAAATAEQVLGEVVRLLGPFAAMLDDVYRFLRGATATEAGTAERLLLDDRAMRRECRLLPLSDAFLRRVRETCLGWRELLVLDVDWDALSRFVRWDGHLFCEHGGLPLLRLLTFLPLLRARPDVADCLPELRRVDAAQASLVQRFERIAETALHEVEPHAEERPPEAPWPPPDPTSTAPQEYVTTVWEELPGLPRPATLALSLPQARAGALPPPLDPSLARRPDPPHGNTLAGVLLFVTLARGGVVRRAPEGARDEDLRRALAAFDDDPRSALARLAGATESAVQAVDEQIVRPAGRVRQRAWLERVLDLVELPFWKERARLYEVWVLIRTARAASAALPLHAEPRVTERDGTRVFSLPKGNGRRPVVGLRADGPDGRLVAVLWFQRRTTDLRRLAQYEPDVRCTLPARPFADLFVVECKDRVGLRRWRRTRRHPAGEGFGDVADRYLDGLRPDLLWLVNYSRLDGPAEPSRRPDGRVARFASEFRPGQVPAAFDDTIRECLRRRLSAARLPPAPATPPAVAPAAARPEPPAPALAPAARIELRWAASPADLDLYLWEASAQPPVHHASPGDPEHEPFAHLEGDVRTGAGPEVIRIERWSPVRYVVAVHQYSGDGALAGCGARVVLESGVGGVESGVESGARWEVPVPAEGSGRWWHVLDVDGTQLGAAPRITVVNRLGAAPPWP